MNVTTTVPASFAETQHVLYLLFACILFLGLMTTILFAEIEEGSNCSVLLSLIRLKLSLLWLRCRGRRRVSVGVELLEMRADLESTESNYTDPIND